MPWIIDNCLNMLELKDSVGDEAALFLGKNFKTFETEFEAVSYVLTESNKRKDEALIMYNSYCYVSNIAASRMKDLTC